MKRIVHFNVGKGNSSVVETDDFVMAIDLQCSEEKSSYELISPFFRTKDNKDCLDVLVVTHGDLDHCGGYKKFQEEIDEGNLIIGKIIHQDFNRIANNEEDLSEDYITFQNEIDRRAAISASTFGDLVCGPKKGDDVSIVMEGVDYPEDLVFNVISSIAGDTVDDGYNVNDLSLVFLFDMDQLGGILFTGDSTSKYWKERLMPNLEENEVNSKYLVVSHHGSYTFFGSDRHEVRNADPYPDNYQSMNEIKPEELIISAFSKFPTSRDASGDLPPHYAAYKWYHKWFEENRDVKDKKEEPHPKSWHYTSEGNICIEWDECKWIVDDDWQVEKAQTKSAKKIGEKHKEEDLSATGFMIKKTRYHGD